MQEGLFTDLFNSNNGNIDINQMRFGSNLQVMSVEKSVAEVARTNHDPAWIMVNKNSNPFTPFSLNNVRMIAIDKCDLHLELDTKYFSLNNMKLQNEGTTFIATNQSCTIANAKFEGDRMDIETKSSNLVEFNKCDFYMDLLKAHNVAVNFENCSGYILAIKLNYGNARPNFKNDWGRKAWMVSGEIVESVKRGEMIKDDISDILNTEIEFDIFDIQCNGVQYHWYKTRDDIGNGWAVLKTFN